MGSTQNRPHVWKQLHFDAQKNNILLSNDLHSVELQQKIGFIDQDKRYCGHSYVMNASVYEGRWLYKAVGDN